MTCASLSELSLHTDVIRTKILFSGPIISTVIKQVLHFKTLYCIYNMVQYKFEFQIFSQKVKVSKSSNIGGPKWNQHN